tara:strand:- start:19970 stop:20788 length:819 start_codon:yes stop_codon:yes gene_type:complete
MNNNIISYINTININKEESIRIDCPICNGINSLSITNFGDVTKFNCFKASCNVKGTYKNDISSESFSKTYDNETTDYKNSRGNSYSPQAKKVLQRYWRGNDFPIELVNYLNNNNCLFAYQNNSADIRYDYQKNRAVFVIKNSRNEVIDAAGRALDNASTPKWYRYGSSRMPYICGNTKCKHAVVVEDCASATAISHYVTGVALLGTHLTEEAEQILCDKFDKVSVALDKDATMKSISLINKLKWNINNVNVIVLERDLKIENNIKGVLKLDD